MERKKQNSDIGLNGFFCYLSSVIRSRPFLVFLCLCVFVSFSGCETIPIIGRSQLSLIPTSQLVTMSADSYSKLLSTSTLSDDKEKAEMVERVGGRIARATEAFLWENGQGYKVRNFDWQFELLEDDENINAFAMPGGKIGAYTGIFKVAPDENSLAAVMAHEVAHVIANHGGERMSQYLLVSLGGLSLDLALKKKEVETRKWWMIAYGVGSTVGYILPYSRKQEAEADRIGLILMAMAGYDPNAAIGLWERMAKESKGRMPTFLSTHPAPRARIADIKARIPEAMEYYKSN